MLTVESIKAYNESPNHCPYCGSENISAAGFDGENAYQNVDCLDCGEFWQDTYAFVGMDSTNDEDQEALKQFDKEK